MKKIFKQSIDLFGKDMIRKEVKEVQGRYNSSGEEHHLPDRSEADREGDRTLQKDCKERRYKA